MSQATQPDRTFKTIAENQLLRGIADVVAEVDDNEAIFYFREDEVYTAVVDPANVFMVELPVPENVFESYDSTGMKWGMKVDRLIDLLKISNAKDLIKLEFNDDTFRLDVEFGGAHYEMSGIDTEMIDNEPELSDLDFYAEGTFEASELKQALRVVDLASDHVFITGKPEDGFVRFTGKGDTDDAYYDVEWDSGETTHEFESVFSLDYMKKVPRITDGDKVDAFFGDEWPCRFEFDVVEGVNIPGVCMVAPRIVKD